MASHPKTPTLEKAAAAALDKSSVDPLPPVIVEEEELTTRSRLAGLKQMSVASIASLRQRLSESRNSLTRKLQQHTVCHILAEKDL